LTWALPQTPWPGLGTKLGPMPNEPIPNFTAPAAKLWATLPPDTRRQLLANVWCAQCRHEVTIANFTGAVKAGSLLLVGLCSECRSDVARLIETD
jgi:hypothetical protein